MSIFLCIADCRLQCSLSSLTYHNFFAPDNHHMRGTN